MSASGTAAGGGWFAFPLTVFRRVRHDALWSLAGNLLTVFSGLATLKIIGRLVSASEYGSASLVLGVFALLNQFIANPLLAERLRLYFDRIRENDRQPFSRAVQGLLLRTSGFIAALYLAGAAVALMLGQATYWQLTLPVLVLVFVQPQLSALFSQLEAHRNYRALSLVQPFATLLQVPLLLALLGMAVHGASSIVLSQALAALLVLVAIQVRWASSRRVERAESPLGQFSLTGLVTALYMFNLTSWVLTTSDRYLVDHYLTRADVGIYVINYAFWSIPYNVLNGWINSFARPRLYARAADQAWGRVFRVVAATLLAGTAMALAGTALIFLIGKPLALRILGERYWHSEQLMLLLASAHIFFIIGHTTSTYFLALKRSHYVWITCLIAAMGNIGANILLLPKWGIIAAASTTLGAYAAWAMMMVAGMLVVAQRTKPPSA